MIKNILLIILAIHAVISIVYAVIIFFGGSYLRKALIIPIIFVPVFGPITGIMIELLNIFGKQGNKPVDLPELTLGEDIYWKTIKEEDGDENIIPLEEALLINDPRTRRKKMLDTLYDNPLKYLDVMLVASHNEDIETSHYATTTISEAQRKYQLQIQRYAVAVEQYPDDIKLLDEYIETLESYIESGLLEDYLLNRQRVIYSKVLINKLAKGGHVKETLIRFLRNSIELNDYPSAVEASDILKRNWPEDEQTWIETFRVCVEGRDEKKLQETIREIRFMNIDWTDQGREQVSLWVQT